MLSRILHYRFVLLFVALAFASASLASCSSNPSNATPAVQDTIHLVSMQGNVDLYTMSQVDTADLKLTCGCPFRLNRTASGGDTGAFQIGFASDDTSKVTPHRLIVQIKPGTPGIHLYSAWFAFSALDHLGGTDYDTLQVIGNLK